MPEAPVGRRSTWCLKVAFSPRVPSKFFDRPQSTQTRLLAQEHLVLVCELLRANLFEFQRFTRASGEPPYFTVPRVRSIARQVGAAGSFLN